MVHFIIINLFDQSGVWICNIFRVKFNWKLLRVNLSITSMEWWLSLPMIAETTGLVLGGEVRDMVLAAEGWLFHSIGVSVDSSPWRALNWFISLIRLGVINLGPRIIQSSALCPILPQYFQILFCLLWRSAIAGWTVGASFLNGRLGTKIIIALTWRG